MDINYYKQVKENEILPRVMEHMLGEIPGIHNGMPGHRHPAEVMQRQRKTQVLQAKHRF